MYKDIVIIARKNAIKFMEATPEIYLLMESNPQKALEAAKACLSLIRKRAKTWFKEKSLNLMKEEAAYHLAFGKELLRLAEENVKNHRPNKTMHDIFTRIAILQSQHATKH